MKNAGFDMIIFEGRSPNPVYLLVENDNAQLIDASDFWGKSVWDTEEGIKAKHQDPLIRVASIGVAGEKGVQIRLRGERHAPGRRPAPASAR